MSEPALESTPLTAAHAALGAKLVPFAGYAMPLHFAAGILKEHVWTREHAGLFDVSHMGPAFLQLTAPSGEGEADHRAIAAIAESLVCGDIAGLKPGRLRYTLRLNDEGGIGDDLIIGRPAEPGRQGSLYMVANAGPKQADFAAFARAAGESAELIRADERALLALQGPSAAGVMAQILPGSTELAFMEFRSLRFEGAELTVSRSGYTGEDGFEVLLAASSVAAFSDRLLAHAEVAPAGLGARDSLRLEAGLPLYGHDLDETTSPIEAGLGFAVSKRRLKGADFPGAGRIAAEMTSGPRRRRVGLRVLEGAPAREGAPLFAQDGAPAGRLTSGGFSPTLRVPIAMGYVEAVHSAAGTILEVEVRARRQRARVVPMPFVPHRYHRRPS